MRKISIFVILISSFVACKPLPAFHVNRKNNQPARYSKVAGRLGPKKATPANATGKPLVIMQTRVPRAAVAVNPENGKVLWKSATPGAASRYVVAGGAVAYYDTKKGVTGLDINTGKEMWTYGLKKGHKLHVFRITDSGGKYVGRITVMKTSYDRAACTVDPGYKKLQVQRGDRVKSQIP